MKIGVFSLEASPAEVELLPPDGDFVNLLDGKAVKNLKKSLANDNRKWYYKSGSEVGAILQAALRQTKQ